MNIIWSEEAVEVSVVEDTIYFPKETDFKKVLIYIYTKLFFDNLSINKYFNLFNITNANKPPIYLPASRTGFMLTYKLLITNIIGNFFGNALESFLGNMSQQETKLMDIQLPDPVVLFLQNLIQVTQSKNSPYQNICNKLEKDIIRGKVKIDNSPIKNFLYQPEGSNNEFPAHVISSLVTELMPLILILQSDLQYKLMIIEEPESHLHLQLQKILTNCLIRLVNSGLSLWTTTHSDTILQQVNNMIKLYNHPGPARDQLAQEFGYEEEDYLNPANVAAYQFKVTDNGKTKVTRLELTDGGFVVPTFNETIVDLSKETLMFEELSSNDNE